jgi:hypothetical protein
MSTLFKRSSSQQQDEMLEMVIMASRKQWQRQHQGPLSKLAFLNAVVGQSKSNIGAEIASLSTCKHAGRQIKVFSARWYSCRFQSHTIATWA